MGGGETWWATAGNQTGGQACATGQHLLLSGAFCGFGCSGGFNGWLNHGRLVPAQPSGDQESDQAW